MTGRISFRKQPKKTGLAAIARPYPATDIKLNGKVIGEIIPPSRFGSDQTMWSIGIQADRKPEEITPASPCGWEWIRFKARFKTEQDARDWFVSVGWPVIVDRYTFKNAMSEDY